MKRYLIIGIVAVVSCNSLLPVDPQQIGNIMKVVAGFGDKISGALPENKKETAQKFISVVKSGGETVESIGVLIDKLGGLKTKGELFINQVNCVKSSDSASCKALGCTSEQACLAKVLVALSDLLTELIQDTLGKIGDIKDKNGKTIGKGFVEFGPAMSLAEFIKTSIVAVSDKSKVEARTAAINKLEATFGSVANNFLSNVEFLKLLALMIDINAYEAPKGEVKPKVEPLALPAEAVEEAFEV